jgi:hypothetical protein
MIPINITPKAVDSLTEQIPVELDRFRLTETLQKTKSKRLLTLLSQCDRDMQEFDAR